MNSNCHPILGKRSSHWPKSPRGAKCPGLCWLSRTAGSGRADSGFGFDEVDTGIGGRTALKVAEKLRSLSGQFQVFAVTHLPIVASFAQHHYYVEKQEHYGRTKVKVTLLDRDGRVSELVRMLGGQADQSATKAHAEELLKQANTS